MSHTLGVEPEPLDPCFTTRPKTLNRNRWVNDFSNSDNLYLQEFLLMVILNVFNKYSGRINDPDTFWPVQHLMSREKALELFDTCTTKSVRESMGRQGRYHHICDPDDAPTRELMRALWSHPKSNLKFRRLMITWLEYAIDTLRKWQSARPDPVKARIDELKDLFSLSDEDGELDALTLEIVLANGMWPTDDFRNPNPFQKVALHSKFLNMTEADYLRLIGPGSRLRRLGCLNASGEFNTDLLSFLTGMDSEPLASRFYKRHDATTLPWAFFGTLAENDGALLKRMIASRQTDQGMNILLYGEPGTGKTSFAAALAAELGLTPYFVAQSDDTTERPRPNTRSFRFTALQVCAGQVDPAKSLLVVDEADALLSSGVDLVLGEAFGFSGPAKAPDKGRLNDIMDALRLPCVWITNTPAEALDISNRRRFDFSIRFNTLNQQQREAIWRNAIAKHDLGAVLGAEDATQFAARYEVSAGGIDIVLRNLGSMLKAGQAEPAEASDVVGRLLTPHCKLLNLQSDNLSGVRPDYTLDGLNIRGDVSPQQIESAVSRFLGEQANGATRDPDRPRMNLLLSGPSGTGKTEFVKHLAASTRMPVVTRMGSDLLSKYVGGTERNIRHAFDQAVAERAILFLDEADGLFQSRERAERSWEVTQVNELLHRMENFDGVLVCATNFAARLDTATLRRFTFKLEFGSLTAEGKRIFYQRLFTPLGVGDLTHDEDSRLTRIPALTPGDYRTVRQSLYYLRESVTVGTLLSALERESAAKHGGAAATTAIGFITV